MTKCLLYMAPIALIGLMATEAPAVPAVWSGGMARNIAAATADAKDAPLLLVRGAAVAVVVVSAVAVAAVIAAGPPVEVPGPVRAPVSTAGTSAAPTSTVGTSTAPISTETPST